MSSPARVLAILELFTHERPIWHPDAINEQLGYTRATGYRYVKELVDAGLLQKLSAGRYALGAKIVELDYHLRHSDPVLLAAAPVMDALAAQTGLDAVLTTMFGQDQLVDTHRASLTGSSLQLRYGRGRPRPLFKGAAPKVILASLPRAAQQRIHDAHAAAAAAAGLGDSWKAFRDYLQGIRAQGYYASFGELDDGVGAVAVPLSHADSDVTASLALVGTVTALQAAGVEPLRDVLKAAVQAIQAQFPG